MLCPRSIRANGIHISSMGRELHHCRTTPGLVITNAWSCQAIMAHAPITSPCPQLKEDRTVRMVLRGPWPTRIAAPSSACQGGQVATLCSHSTAPKDGVEEVHQESAERERDGRPTLLCSEGRRTRPQIAVIHDCKQPEQKYWYLTYLLLQRRGFGIQ